MAKDGSYDDWRVCLAPACALVRRVAISEAPGPPAAIGETAVNAQQPRVFVDLRWQGFQLARVLLHPECAQKVAAFYRMGHPEMRYGIFTGEMLESDRCDLCGKALLWDLAEHLVEVDHPGPPAARLGRGD
jgi:hypothetical protein